MKKINKRILSTLLPISFLATTCGTLSFTSCSNSNIDHTYDELAKQIKNDAIVEFKDISKVYRETFHTRDICDYLKGRIQFLSPNAVIQEDNYNAKLIDDTADEEESSGNLIINIPATAGCENWKKLAIQGHMDMVCTGDVDSIKQDGVIVSINDDDTITSKDKKTSLGADNGLGLGIMLAMLRDVEFDHGPIKYIITADEEAGAVGGRWLGHKEGDEWKHEDGAEVLKDCYALINIDNETEGMVLTSTAGCVNSTYTLDAPDEDIDTTKNIYKLTIAGLKGGHSGTEVSKGGANAIELANNVISSISDIKLISFTSPDATSPGAIQPKAIVTFGSNIDYADIKSSCEKDMVKIKAAYPGEDKLEWKIEKANPIEGMKQYSNATSKNIIDLISHLYFGVYTWKNFEQKVPETSRNIGPIELGWVEDGTTGENKDFNLTTFSRSCNEKHLDSIAIYDEALQGEYLTDGIYKLNDKQVGWSGENDKPFAEYIKEKYESFGVHAWLQDVHGGLENGWFKSFNPDMLATSFGPTIEDAHSVDETLRLNTVDSTIKIILSSVEYVKSIT